MAEHPPPDFAALGLTPVLARRAAQAGWHRPTPVQAAALPPALQGRDLLALAPTGSGKTAAFLLPLLQRLLAEPGVHSERPRRLRGLVLAPTRELAAQTAATALALAPELRTVVAVGGLSINPQMMALRGGAHLVVATPGRLLDLIAQRALHLSDVRCLVLDEADRLLDLGFADEIRRLLVAVPGARQTLLFSATLPDAVAVLAARVLHAPLHIEIAAAERAGGPDDDARDAAQAAAAAGTADAAAATDDTVPPLITQRAIVVDSARRTPLLRQLVQQQRWPRVLVFVATQYAAEHVADKLRQAGVAAAALHGRLSMGRRSQALADLQRGALNVLVATDLAARGIDIPQLEVVVNHDLPRSATDHVHRIGRTGRAGAAGLAISFICADAPGSEAHFRLIEKRQRQRVPRERVPGFEPAAAAPAPATAAGPEAAATADPHGGIKGRRPSRKDKLRAAAASATAAAGPAPPPAPRRPRLRSA